MTVGRTYNYSAAAVIPWVELAQARPQKVHNGNGSIIEIMYTLWMLFAATHACVHTYAGKIGLSEASH